MKYLVACLIVGMTSLSVVDAYNFRSKQAPKQSSQKMYKGSQPTQSVYESSHQNNRSMSNYKRGVDRNNYQSPVKSTVQSDGFGFEGFNQKPVRTKTLPIQQRMSKSRNMSRGPQRRAETKRVTQKRQTKRVAKKVVYAPKQKAHVKIQGYKGEFYGGGNALFQVDPGLIGRWSKPGLSVKKQGFIK